MMKVVQFILLGLLSYIPVKAQIYFNKEFPNDSSNTNTGSMVYAFPDTSGYLVMGNFGMPGYKAYIRFLRLTINGDTLWTKVYRNRPLAQFTSNGNYITIGDTNLLYVGLVSTDTTDELLINVLKIDTAGNVLWDYIYGDAGKETPPFDIAKTKDKGYIITGWTTGWGASTNAFRTFLLKLDSLGNEEWHKIYFTLGGTSNAGTSIDTTNDNGYIISGVVNNGSNQNDLYVMRIDSLGNQVWMNFYGSPYFDWGRAYVKKYNANEYLLAGGITVNSGNGLNSQTYLAKIDGQNGTIIWADTAGTDQSNYNEGFDSTPIILNSGAIVLIGSAEPSSGGSALLAKYSSNGIKQWERFFNKYGANNYNYFWDVHETYDKGLIACGDFTNISVPEQPLWVVKLDSMGCEVINCSVGVEETSTLEQPTLLIYPNPSSGIFNVEMNAEQAEIEVFSITGQLVERLFLKNGIGTINITLQPKGLYIVKMKTSYKTIVRKIVYQ